MERSSRGLGDRGRYLQMKSLLPILSLLLAFGCTGTTTSDQDDSGSSLAAERSQPRYTVLTQPPDAILDQMRSDYTSDYHEIVRRWTARASALPLNGQRAIELLEVACYADVMCHPIEYPLRVATLDYVEEHMHTADVEDALRWVQASYKSGLPIDTPGDQTGQLRGILVHAMGIRMNNYADELLQPQNPSQHRK